MARQKQKSKAARGLVSCTILYRDRRDGHHRNRTLKVDVRRGATIENQHAAAMVAVRTSTPLTEVEIVQVTRSV